MEAQDGARVRNEDVPPQNQDLSFLLPAVTAFLSEYGWYAAFTCVGVYLLLQHLRKNRSTDSQSSPVSTSSQDPDSVVRRQVALEASRRRMQEEQDARAAELRERQQRLEEDKRRQKIEMWDSMKEGKSYKGKAQVTEHRRGHFLQLTETKDRQKAPSQQWIQSSVWRRRRNVLLETRQERPVCRWMRLKCGQTDL
ncbi:selenoprotein S isoform X1 [Sinocyclocheilus grahami]|uniref:selenoprotein S isoform X1 n=1 Tax=Sinocyclocheilus grahami TaxID=75366 RepID=UPI0007AC724A|nr:PREDICTED: selenoprotein S isoform X1 [Sinocyclocheilus grahami]